MGGKSRWCHPWLAVTVSNDKSASRTAGEIILYIRQVLRSSSADLAVAFNVDHQTFDSWLGAASLPPAQRKRLNDLEVAANIIEQGGFACQSNLIRRRFSGGNTLLRGTESAKSRATKLVAILKREAAEGERLSARLAGRQTPATSPDFDFPN